MTSRSSRFQWWHPAWIIPETQAITDLIFRVDDRLGQYALNWLPEAIANRHETQTSLLNTFKGRPGENR